MAEMRKGGDTGPAVVPGDLDESLLIKAVRYDDEVLRMPPQGKLPERQIAALAQWVKHGAIGPSVAKGMAAKLPPGLDFESARGHWSYQPIQQPAIPAVHGRDWPRSPIDSFVLAKLEVAGLTPSPPADRRTLIRPRVLRPGWLAADRRGSRVV